MQTATSYPHPQQYTSAPTKVRNIQGSVILGLITLCRVFLLWFNVSDIYEAWCKYLAQPGLYPPEITAKMWGILYQIAACEVLFVVSTLMIILGITPLASNLTNKITAVLLALDGIAAVVLRGDFRIALLCFVTAAPFFVPMESESFLHARAWKIEQQVLPQ